MTPPTGRTAAADARIPAQHPFAEHLRRVAAAEQAAPHRPWTPDDGPLPALYVSHGGGPLPLENPEWLDLPTTDPDRLLALGERLRPLREQGGLVVGSGHMTHGLPFLTADMFTRGVVPGWSSDFDGWAAEALTRGDVDELARFRTAAPG